VPPLRGKKGSFRLARDSGIYLRKRGGRKLYRKRKKELAVLFQGKKKQRGHYREGKRHRKTPQVGRNEERRAFRKERGPSKEKGESS